MKTRREPVDMSPEAIARRLEDMRQLYRLMLELKKFERAEVSTTPVARGS